MVEFALLVPVLMLMLLGLADVARAVYTYNIISNSAREGTREAILAYNQCHNAGAPCSTPPAGSTVIGVDNAIKRAGAGVVSYVFNDTATDTGTPPQPLCTPLPNQGCVWIFIVNDDILSAQTCVNLGPSDTFAGAPCDFNASKEGGSRNVVVEIEYNFSPFTPLVAKALGSSTVMWAKSEMRTEY